MGHARLFKYLPGMSTKRPHSWFLLLMDKENSKSPRHWPSPVTSEFPVHMASNTEIFPLDDVIMIQVKMSLYFGEGLPPQV